MTTPNAVPMDISPLHSILVPAQSGQQVVQTTVQNNPNPTPMQLDNIGLGSMLDIFSNFNYTPPANMAQYGAEPYNTASQLNPMINPAAFFNVPTQQAQTAINTVTNPNAVQNSNAPTQQVAQITTQNQNPIENIITDIENSWNNLIKTISGK